MEYSAIKITKNMLPVYNKYKQSIHNKQYLNYKPIFHKECILSIFLWYNQFPDVILLTATHYTYVLLVL